MNKKALAQAITKSIPNIGNILERYNDIEIKRQYWGLSTAEAEEQQMLIVDIILIILGLDTTKNNRKDLKELFPIIYKTPLDMKPELT